MTTFVHIARLLPQNLIIQDTKTNLGTLQECGVVDYEPLENLFLACRRLVMFPVI